MAKKAEKKGNPIDLMLDKIRKAIGECEGPTEKDTYEALVSEAEGWKMRLEELEDGEED